MFNCITTIHTLDLHSYTYMVVLMFHRRFIIIMISNDIDNIMLFFNITLLDCIAVMITGITGVGKSTACNFFLGENIFKVGQGMIPVTSKSGEHTAVVNSRELKIIDTPGFCEDNVQDGEEDISELGKAILFARDGVHAIGLVINSSQRVTSSQMTLLKELELFGELWPFMFIIFTAAKGYGDTEKEQRNAIDNMYKNPRCPEIVKMLLDKVDKRYIVLESTDTNPEYKAKKVEEFFKMVDRIYNANKRLYTKELFKQAAQLYQEEKEKGKNKENAYKEQIQILKKCITEKLAQIRRQCESQMQSIIAKANSKQSKLERKIEELEVGTTI